MDSSDELRLNSDGSDQDDWNEHWDRYGDVSVRNPANEYRHALIIKLLGELRSGSTILDIGSGQGQFAIDYQKLHPDLDVWGVEYSEEGVRRGNAAAARFGLKTRFIQRDLLNPVALDPDQPKAGYALCSEVLEHVQDPARLMRNAVSLLAPGAKIVVTVPGGPRSAFDKHIGHFRHFTAPLLREVLTDAGLDVDRVLRSGFPFYNLYKLAVILRGKKLVREVDSRTSGARPSRLESIVTAFFRRAFSLNREDSRFGWQLAAVAHVPAARN